MFASPAFAQSTGAAQGSGGFLPILLQMAPLILIFGIFYLLLIRPQQQKLKEQRNLIDSAKKGDTVVTGGGLIGKVLKVDGDEVEIELGPNVKVRALKATLSDVRSGSKPAND
ncbi:preprotein translocase subunit YajC [Sphingomonas sp. BIUV-7]|uniref:Sec translocon accessory complex subunit YajC n=1 Tax=Sphingomonas natans TaxID=3063330 RepID=A0ABT8YEM6_9SPHN|nr:preprotein translocase subunit YajC [Sphingomonas sp. BIUV-7]MDO6416792.1 preprotein translocase subunit YajC [Sphingomonas sp. BIUV-7]